MYPMKSLYLSTPLALTVALCSTVLAAPALAESPVPELTAVDAEAMPARQMAFATRPILPPLRLGATSGSLLPQISAEPPMRVRSVGMIVGGSCLGAAGLISVPAGFLLYATSALIQCDACAPGEACSCGSDVGAAVGLGFMGLGLASIGGGIAMIVIGAKKVPDTPSAALRIRPGGFSFEGRF